MQSSVLTRGGLIGHWMYMKTIRNSAKAIIIEDGRLLTTKNRGHDRIFHILPGGGQRAGETLHETLKRECREEIGCDVKIGRLVWIREFRVWRHEFPEFNPDEHLVEFMFRCSIEGGFDAKSASQPDKRQIGVEWIAISEIERYPFYPQALKPLLPSIDDGISPVYLGEVD